MSIHKYRHGPNTGSRQEFSCPSPTGNQGDLCQLEPISGRLPDVPLNESSSLHSDLLSHRPLFVNPLFKHSSIWLRTNTIGMRLPGGAPGCGDPRPARHPSLTEERGLNSSLIPLEDLMPSPPIQSERMIHVINQ
jgi:hypothetical protein